jgi:DNA adenine methylase
VNTCPEYKPPFPWFGGKSRVAELVWSRFGEVRNYIEPFFGSGAVLFRRPGGAQGVETVNDADGFVANFWRAVQQAPDEVAQWADWPVNENDLHARHVWLSERRDNLAPRLEADPDFYDSKIAGWWVWGICSWIGGGWCGDSGAGPWTVQDGPYGPELRKGNAGRGVSRRLPHLHAGMGVSRQLPHLGDAGMGVSRPGGDLAAYMQSLCNRLRGVRVCCGDWSRVCGFTPTVKLAPLTAVFLDPPYSAEAGRDMGCYHGDEGTVAHQVREWCLERGGDERLRVALCGYEGEHEALEGAGWECVPWKARGGYANLGNGRGRVNAGRERIWFSPHCVKQEEAGLLEWKEGTTETRR